MGPLAGQGRTTGAVRNDRAFQSLRGASAAPPVSRSGPIACNNSRAVTSARRLAQAGRGRGTMDSVALAQSIIDRAGWTLVGDFPDVPVGVIIGAPHTSNWDFVAFLAMTRARGVTPHFMIKKEAFRGPVGPLMRRLGGVAIDRSAAGGVVADMLNRAASGEHFMVTIAPEGTRKAGKYWKSGFYRIACEGNFPIIMGSIDGPTKVMEWGPHFVPTGEVTRDMDFIREYYAGKRGLVQANRTEPRLREEDRTD